MKFYSPLRYPGGKNKVAEFIHCLVKDNNLEGGIYVEPYAGGASVALSLLIEGKVSKVVINDFDRSIYAFWFSVLNHTHAFCERIKKTSITIETWRIEQEIQTNKASTNLFDLGFSTFFLNRTNHSGIISGGPIGGYAQSGVWKLNARFNKSDLIKRIKKIAEYKNSIKLYNLDARALVSKISKDLSENTLIYFDPPYYVKGKELYVNHYTHKDHVLVAKTVRKISEPRWIVSYDNVREINKLYEGCKRRVYNLSYSVVNGTMGKEVMFFSKNLDFKTK
jgi:DNA adenine methylase